MKYDILTIGWPMHEIIRQERQGHFPQLASYLGPYPSGDTCIMLDVAAKLGRTCCFIGAGGDDAFGNVVPDRLAKDGVDVRLLKRIKGTSSIVIFVRYDEHGKREYLNFMDEKVLDGLDDTLIEPDIIASARWIHFSGEIISLCQKEGRRKCLMKLLRAIAPDSKVSLDPNFTIPVEDMQEAVGPFLKRANLILPSEGEASLMMGTKTDAQACQALCAQGKIVVLKKGRNGCDIYAGGQVIHVDGYRISEVDPTGCGDSFCAGFLTGMLEGWPLEKTGRFANAAGALQATRMGPMEGAFSFPEVVQFMQSQEKEEENNGN